MALLAGNMPAQSINQDIYAYLFAVTVQPCCGDCGPGLGEIRMRHVRERHELEEALAQSVGQERELAPRSNAVNTVRQSLGSRIREPIADGRYHVSGCAFARPARSERSPPRGGGYGAGDLNPVKCSLYLLRDDALGKYRSTWLDSEDIPHSSVQVHIEFCFQEVIGSQRVLCAVNPEDEVVSHWTGGVSGRWSIAQRGGAGNVED